MSSILKAFPVIVLVSFLFTVSVGCTTTPPNRPASTNTRPVETTQRPAYPVIILLTKVSEQQTIESLTPQPGWKYVVVEFAIENISARDAIAGLSRTVLASSILKTAEGFQYPASTLSRSTYFGAVGQYNHDVFDTLPPGFRALGVFRAALDYAFVYDGPPPSDTQGLINRVAFRVAVNTSGYKLNIPGFAEVDLAKGAVDLKSLRFPTNRSDSEFKTVGTPIGLPDGSTFTVEGVEDRTYMSNGNVSNVKIRVRFHNAGVGYEKGFSYQAKFFGDDGILYTNSRNIDGYYFGQDVAPGQDNIGYLNIVTSPVLKSGKLVISGNNIYNIQLPNSH